MTQITTLAVPVMTDTTTTTTTNTDETIATSLAATWAATPTCPQDGSTCSTWTNDSGEGDEDQYSPYVVTPDLIKRTKLLGREVDQNLAPPPCHGQPRGKTTGSMLELVEIVLVVIVTTVLRVIIMVVLESRLIIMVLVVVVNSVA